MPYFIHLPLILDPDGGKLSKRKGSVSAKDFVKQGYPPEAVINFLMLLGWSSPIKHEFGEKEREIFGLDEFVKLFDVKDLNKSSAIFNREKLLWFSHQYIMNFSVDELQRKYGEWHAKYSEEKDLRLKIAKKGDIYLKEVLKLVQDRVKLLSEVDELIKLFYFEPEKVKFSEFKQIKNLSDGQVSLILNTITKELNKKSESLEDWPHEKWEEFMRNLAEENGLGAGKVFMTLRLAITSSPTTPPLYEIMTVLGKKEILTRLSKYVDNI
jgi:glutamyl-tRNA synthetase